MDAQILNDKGDVFIWHGCVMFYQIESANQAALYSLQADIANDDLLKS